MPDETRERLCLIVNPAAGRGRALQRLDAARQALARVGCNDVRVSTHAGEEAELTEAAVREGVTGIAVLGGDGTVSTVAGALVRLGEAGRRCHLAFFAAGTGNDFAKNVGSPSRDYDAMSRILAGGASRTIDVGEVDGRTFVNVAGFGFDAAVVSATARPRVLQGEALYLAESLRQLFTYRGLDAAVNQETMRRYLMLVFANGPCFGGKFVIAPRAQLDDGALDLVSLSDASAPQRVRLFAAAARGAHLGLAGVNVLRDGDFSLRFQKPPLFEADGELHQARSTEVRVTCRAAALRVATPA
jgi:diacylglycerol kinase (ATP)